MTLQDWPTPDELAQVRFVATDIDGTLLQTGVPIPERTKEAVRGCVDAGISVVPVTGRPLRWLDSVIEQLPELHWGIAINGAAVLDFRSGNLAATHAIDPQTVAQLAARIRAAIPEARLGFETARGPFVGPGFADGAAHSRDANDPVDSRRHAPIVEPGTEASVEGVLKFIVRHAHDRDADALLERVLPHCGDELHATHSNPRSGIVEVAAPGVTKASTLSEFCASLGLRAEHVAAFGDMPNDVEMLRWAGLSFAMTEGDERAHRAARFRAPAHADGGIAPVLEAILAARG